MRVKSDLADMQIELGGIRRHGDELVVESAPESSIDARIRVDASEARSILGRLLRSGAVWGFLIRLPFSRLSRSGRARGSVRGEARASGTPRREGRPALHEGGEAFAPRRSPDNPAWRERRERTGLNKPW